jgi:hypothetical protein
MRQSYGLVKATLQNTDDLQQEKLTRVSLTINY